MTMSKGSKFAPYNDLAELCRRNRQLRCVIVTHTKPHFDEMLAIELLTGEYGQGTFNFSDDPIKDIEYWGAGGNTPDGRPWQEHVKEGKILLGCAPGSPFDPEHPVEGKTIERGQTCASSVATFLRIKDRPGVRAVLKPVVEHDLFGSRDSFHLGLLIKALHRYNDPVDVARWSCFAIAAILMAQAEKERGTQLAGINRNLLFPGRGLHPAIELAAAWQLNKRHPDFFPGADLGDIVMARHSGRLPNGMPWKVSPGAKLLARYDQRRDGDLLDCTAQETNVVDFMPVATMFKHLRNHVQAEGGADEVVGFKHAVECMLVTGVQPWIIARWVGVAIEAKVNDGLNHLKATKELQLARNAGQERVAVFCGEPVNIVFAVTDNPVFQSAARGRKIDVFVLANSNGQTSVFCSKQTFKQRFAGEIDDALRTISAELRRREFERKGKPAPSDPQLLRSEGSLPDLREWMYHKELMMVMNGGTSASGVPATRLSLEEIVGIVYDVLNSQA